MSPLPPIGYVDPNFPDPNGPQDAPIIIYGYTPSFALGLLGVSLFTISTILHSFQVLRHRSWFCLLLVIGSTMEIVGYTFRILSAKRDPYNIIYFVIQYFFIVVAPVFFSAAIYMVLSKLIYITGRQYSPIPPNHILRLFIVSDVVATGIQIAGAASIGRQESARKDPTAANNILLAGLAFQVFSFLIFLFLLSAFIYRARKVVMASMASFLFAYMTASLLVYLRTCFRLAETSRGVHGALSNHEVYFGCLEFAPVVAATFLFNGWHPGKWLTISGRD